MGGANYWCYCAGLIVINYLLCTNVFTAGRLGGHTGATIGQVQHPFPSLVSLCAQPFKYYV